MFLFISNHCMFGVVCHRQDGAKLRNIFEISFVCQKFFFRPEIGFLIRCGMVRG